MGQIISKRLVGQQRPVVSRWKNRHLYWFIAERVRMKNLAKFFTLCALVVSGAAQARQELHPVPEAPIVYHEAQMPEHGAFVESHAVPLYTNVKYKDLDEMSPCAVPKIIAVKDPCACDDKCGPPQCVYIQICIPQCGCELISCKRNGDRIRYDYGEYAVDVRIKKNHIEVDYQD